MITMHVRYIYTYVRIVIIVTGVTKPKCVNISVSSDNSPHGSQPSDIVFEEKGDVNEQLYQKWFEEGYDIYDEDYVKWLMANHPNDVLSEWLTVFNGTSYHYSLTTRQV